MSRGGSASRGGPPSRSVAPTTVGLPDSSSHITTIGVKRSDFGRSGRAIEVFTNHFKVKIPENNIHHYDGASLSFLMMIVHQQRHFHRI